MKTDVSMELGTCNACIMKCMVLVTHQIHAHIVAPDGSHAQLIEGALWPVQTVAAAGRMALPLPSQTASTSCAAAASLKSTWLLRFVSDCDE